MATRSPLSILLLRVPLCFRRLLVEEGSGHTMGPAISYSPYNGIDLLVEEQVDAMHAIMSPAPSFDKEVPGKKGSRHSWTC